MVRSGDTCLAPRKVFDLTTFHDLGLSQTIVATLSVSWPSFRYERGDEAGKVDKVKAAAARISHTLGYEA